MPKLRENSSLERGLAGRLRLKYRSCRKKYARSGNLNCGRYLNKKYNLNSTAAVCCIHCMSVCTYRLCFVLLSFLCPRLQSYGPLKTLFSTCPFVCACVDACLRVWSETFCACRPLLGIIFYLKILLYIYWHSNVTLCNFLIIIIAKSFA